MDLMTEANENFDKTGLRPRQLAEQRAELLVACKELLATHEDTRFADSFASLSAGKAVAKARAAIANATSEPA